MAKNCTESRQVCQKLCTTPACTAVILLAGTSRKQRKKLQRVLCNPPCMRYIALTRRSTNSSSSAQRSNLSTKCRKMCWILLKKVLQSACCHLNCCSHYSIISEFASKLNEIKQNMRNYLDKLGEENSGLIDLFFDHRRTL